LFGTVAVIAIVSLYFGIASCLFEKLFNKFFDEE